MTHREYMQKYSKKRYLMNKAAGLCGCGRKARKGRTRCSPCLTHAKAYTVKQQRKYKGSWTLPLRSKTAPR